MRDERPLFRWVYGCLSLTNGCEKCCAPHLCDCHLPCDLAKWRRARNTKLNNYSSELDIRATLPYLEGKFFNLNCIYNALNNNTINKHCQNIAKACTLIYVCAVVSGVKHVSSFVSFLCIMYIHTYMHFKCTFNNIQILLFHIYLCIYIYNIC